MCSVKLLTGVCATLLAATGGLPSAQSGAPASDLAKSEEYLVLGDAVRGGGEPQIAVNPLNPKNIVITSMANLHRLGDTLPSAGRGGAQRVGGEDAPVAAARGAAAGAVGARGARGGRGGAGGILLPGGADQNDPNTPTGKFYRTPGATICQAAVTQDGGITWKVFELPLRHDQYIRCSDVIASAGPDGTLYAGGEPLSPPMEIAGGATRRDCAGSYVMSTDGGNTWSKPVEFMSSDWIRQNHFAPGLTPDINGLVSDRPWIVIDQSSGKVYVTSHGATKDSPQAGQRWVAASTDKGRTFGLAYRIDSADYPAGNGQVAAAWGQVAVAYTATAVPATEVATCPCFVFGLSKDDGKTYERHVVGTLTGVTPRQLVADPSKAGRFAVLGGDNAQLTVTMTEDFGKTWTKPVVAGATPTATPNKPWMAYSSKGDLALMWRAIYPNRSYDVFASASHDGGRTFSAPFKVSRAMSPPPSRERGAFLFGDDLSTLWASADAVHIVWADSRSGFQGVWYGNVPFTSFDFAGK